MKRGEKDRVNQAGKEQQKYAPLKVAQWIAASLAGELTEEEEKSLMEWRNTSDKNRQLYERILNKENRELKRAQFKSFDKETGWRAYKSKQSHEKKISGMRILRMARYAAVLLVPLCVALYLWMEHSGEGDVVSVMTSHTIEPGGAKASLTLATGVVVDLAATSGTIRVDEGMVIRNQGNLLSYQDTSSLTEPDSIMYNEVYVPKGGEYQLVLSDGTLVYLNSMTRIRYPVKFSGDTRNVEIEGEAYFEVTRNEEKPFVVRTACYDVTVLGTQFNITTYGDEEMTSTTLVQGVVAVSGKGIAGERRLQVNERFELDKVTGRVSVKKVDVSYYTAWKDGKFRFRDVRLEEIMRSVERWYDVTVVYDDSDVKDFRFGFNMSRHETIEPLLRIFELNGKVKIEREGKVLKIKRGR